MLKQVNPVEGRVINVATLLADHQRISSKTPKTTGEMSSKEKARFKRERQVQKKLVTNIEEIKTEKVKTY